jgi:hypothetical protein
MTKRNKFVILTVLVVVLIGAIFVAVSQRPPGKVEPYKPVTNVQSGTTSTTEVTFAQPTNEQVGEVAGGWKTMRNRECGFVYRLPSDWSVFGPLGESDILSPEDVRTNEAWAKEHKDILAKEEGDAPLEQVSRSLYISCQYDVKTYLGTFVRSSRYGEFADKTTLAEAFATAAFKANDSNPAVIGVMEVDGRKAYEISYSVRMPDGTTNTTNEIVTEVGSKVLEIQLGHATYKNLSDTVKLVIDSIKLVE